MASSNRFNEVYIDQYVSVISAVIFIATFYGSPLALYALIMQAERMKVEGAPYQNCSNDCGLSTLSCIEMLLEDCSIMHKQHMKLMYCLNCKDTEVSLHK